MEIRLRPDQEAHLKLLCEEMGRTVDAFAGEAILTFMEDYEDVRDAHAALLHVESGAMGTITQEELEKKYALEDRFLANGREANGRVGQDSAQPHHEVFAGKSSRAA